MGIMNAIVHAAAREGVALARARVGQQGEKSFLFFLFFVFCFLIKFALSTWTRWIPCVKISDRGTNRAIAPFVTSPRKRAPSQTDAAPDAAPSPAPASAKKPSTDTGRGSSYKGAHKGTPQALKRRIVAAEKKPFAGGKAEVRAARDSISVGARANTHSNSLRAATRRLLPAPLPTAQDQDGRREEVRARRAPRPGQHGLCRHRGPRDARNGRHADFQPDGRLARRRARAAAVAGGVAGVGSGRAGRRARVVFLIVLSMRSTASRSVIWRLSIFCADGSRIACRYCRSAFRPASGRSHLTFVRESLSRTPGQQAGTAGQ